MQTGIPLASPVRPNEAVALAELIFQLASGPAFHPSLRDKLRSALPTLSLETLRPKPHTLSPDPIHAGTFYLIVTNPAGEAWLLHFAPASAPESSLFAKPALIARVRPSGGREIVVNAVPAAANLPALVTTLLPHFHARSTAVHHLWSLPATGDFLAFLRHVPHRPNLLPALRVTHSTWEPYLPLLLSDWREGFVFIWEGLRAAPSAEEAAPFSRFSFSVDSLADPRSLAGEIQTLRSRLARAVDVEVDCGGLGDIAPAQLTAFLSNLKLLGAPVQSVELPRGLDPAAFDPAHPWGFTIPCREPDSVALPGRLHWKIIAAAD